MGNTTVGLRGYALIRIQACSATQQQFFATEPYNLRIEHFGSEHCLHLTCGVCDHTGTIGGQNLRDRYQPYERITILAAGFTCTKCGTTGHATWRVISQGSN